MKIRTGFVSNSSSSSFTCDVCGASFTGYDGEYDEEVYNCVNGHSICGEDIVANNVTANDDGEIEEKDCPICSFIVFSQRDLSAYLVKLTGIPRQEAFDEVKKLNKRRKKLYEEEYIMYACTKSGINKESLMSQVKEKFASYKAFQSYLKATDKMDCGF